MTTLKASVISGITISLIFTVAWFNLSSCIKDDHTELIKSKINIKPWELLDTNNREFVLYSSTEKIYPCCNYFIIFDSFVRYNEVYIRFNSIYKPEICLTALGPAKADVNLGRLPEGTYSLNIFVHKLHNSGRLIVTNDYYKLDLPNSKSISIENNKLYRIPDNTIWGYTSYRGSIDGLEQSFIDSLQILGANEKEFNPGEYGYFKIEPDGEFVMSGTQSSIRKHFIFEYPNEVSLIENLVRNYAVNHPDSLRIRLYTDKGKILTQ